MKTTLITLMITMLAIAGFGQTATPPTGDGTEINPYQIDNLDNLYWITQNSSEWGAFYIQTSDIDASETYGWDNDSGFLPIGNYNTNFTGSYDGQGHVIDSLFINRPDTLYIGLFGYVTNTDVKIQQLGITNANITGKTYTGTLVGNLWEGTVSNCYSTGSINAKGDRAGGLIGQNINGYVENCYSKSDITGLNFTGGLIGLIWDNGVLTNSYSTGSVSGSGAGGLVGGNNGIVEYSFWDTLTSGQNTSAGGTPKTTAELKDICMYTYEGNWDFMNETENGTNDYWGINSEKNEGYPFFAWQGFTNAGDELKPELITKDTLLFLDGTGMASITGAHIVESASDNCELNDTTISQLSFGCINTGEVTIDVTVTDKSGNDTTGQSIISVEDTILPSLTVKDTTIYLDETGMASITKEYVIENASDNCELNDTTISQLTFGCENTGEITIDVSVTDKGGNDTTAQSVITVIDTIIPSLSVRNTPVYLNESGNYQLEPNDIIDTAWDNCSIKDTTIEGKMKYSCTDIDSAFTLEVTLIDNTDSITQKTAIVTVKDTIKPNLSTKDTTVLLDNNGQASVTPSEIIKSASDNCSIEGTVISQTEFTNDDVGEVTVNVTVEDESGNSTTKTAIITVNAEETGIHTIAGQKIKIYPNPANGFVYIDTEIKTLQVKIINLNGKTVYEGYPGNTSNKIDIGTFSAGLYIIQIEKDDTIINHKLMVK